ncbi:MAG: DUF3422 domain-containing protein [Alphaproteobacteria bacterium]|nr:DUF3422 domain-containing protein [Alphaproteobacteria bacterium]
MAAFKEHPLREALAAEMHARPHGVIDAPAKISYIAVINDETGAGADQAHLSELCQLFKVPAPPEGTTHFTGDLGPMRLKWERHTEFSAYTFILEAPFEQPFKDTVIEQIPQAWLQALPGEVLVASHFAMDSEERAVKDVVGLFDNNTVVGAHVSNRRAMVWTDFQIHGDRFRRFLVRNVNNNHRAMARLVQRVAEIETYRSLTMLALPLAREARERVSVAELEVSASIAQLAVIEGVEGEQDLLARLSALAAEAESVSAQTSYRFSAALAYSELVARRLKELREERIDGLQPMAEFIERRLGPAMETIENVAKRLESLSLRIARASNLLRTRVDVALEGQNRDLLRSMDRRAKTQLRLQATVEGLSVVAISYYLLSLVSYLAKGAKGLGATLDPFVAVVFAFPVVFAGVWFSVRRVRKSIAKKGDDAE